MSYAIGRAANETLIGVATGGAASAKGGKVAKAASYGLRAFDATGNVVNAAEGVNEIREKGMSVSSVAKVAGAGLGIAGDLADATKALSKLKKGRRYATC